MEQCFAAFDKITDRRQRAVTDRIQSLLHRICEDDIEVQALMIYLVEECGVLLARIQREIKAPHLRLGLDLRRQQALVSA